MKTKVDAVEIRISSRISSKKYRVTAENWIEESLAIHRMPRYEHDISIEPVGAAIRAQVYYGTLDSFVDCTDPTVLVGPAGRILPLSALVYFLEHTDPETSVFVGGIVDQPVQFMSDSLQDVLLAVDREFADIF